MIYDGKIVFIFEHDSFIHSLTHGNPKTDNDEKSRVNHISQYN